MFIITDVVTNACVNNGGCSHFCFPSGMSAVCGCPDNATLTSDMKTCASKLVSVRSFEFIYTCNVLSYSCLIK